MPFLSRDRVSVLCVDDNAEVAEAIRIKLSRLQGFAWTGWLPKADQLVEYAKQIRPQLILLDVDMPGLDPFAALAELSKHCPESRVLVFSGHVRGDLIERALDTGAWGYVSKNDGEDELLEALNRVAGGDFALSPEVRRVYDSLS